MNLWQGLVRGALVLVAVALASGGCGGGKTDPTSGASFAAPVGGTDAFVGVVVNPGDRRVLAYVCDGQALAAGSAAKPIPTAPWRCPARTVPASSAASRVTG